MSKLSLIVQVYSLVGAGLCLVAYAGYQLGWLDARKKTYNILNLVGASILGYLAMSPFQAGFFVMEVSWALISLYALIIRR